MWSSRLEPRQSLAYPVRGSRSLGLAPRTRGLCPPPPSARCSSPRSSARARRRVRRRCRRGSSRPTRTARPRALPRNLHVSEVTQTSRAPGLGCLRDNVAVAGYYVFGDRGKATLDPRLDKPEYTLDGPFLRPEHRLAIVAFDDSPEPLGEGDDDRLERRLHRHASPRRAGGLQAGGHQ